MVSSEGLKPPTYCLEGSSSIQLSYEDIWWGIWDLNPYAKAQEPKSSVSTISTNPPFYLLKINLSGGDILNKLK